MDLVNYTEKFINHANKEYGQVWVSLIKMIILIINLMKDKEM